MMSHIEHALKIDLKLKWLHGNEYEAKVTVQITDTCYKEIDLRHGLPPGTVSIPEIAYLTYDFSHEGEHCGQTDRPVLKTANLSSAGKEKVTAFVVVNGNQAGHVTEEFPRRD